MVCSWRARVGSLRAPHRRRPQGRPADAPTAAIAEQAAGGGGGRLGRGGGRRGQVGRHRQPLADLRSAAAATIAAVAGTAAAAAAEQGEIQSPITNLVNQFLLGNFLTLQNI